ncbi:MAG: isochorismatase family protein [Deltaproteobacteria bacterium]|nr:isochorismatase family protein [Deltaproteobacteria bacterium]
MNGVSKENWRDLIPEEVKRVYQNAGFGGRLGFGRRPGVLVIDMQVAQIGDKPEPVLESVRKYPLSAGEAGWAALEKIKELLNDARHAEIPVIYTVIEHEPFDRGLWKNKMPPAAKPVKASAEEKAIVKEIAPRAGDVIIRKKRSSAFFGTPLLSYLHHMGVDTLLITGCTTGSCVRTTVLDASQNNFYPVIVEECVFDRSWIMHAFNLFEIDAKWADVTPLREVQEYLRGLSAKQ